MIWGQVPEKTIGVIGAIRKKLAAMLLVVAAGGLVLLSVIADATIAVTGRYAAARLVGGELLWHAAQLLVSTLVLTALFASVFRTLPRRRAPWRAVLRGAAGSIVVVLLWAYWSAQIFFFGLEFTRVYATDA